jgi:RND family efflux transporter MFP subunit
MKRWIPWTVAALVAVLVAAGALRALSARKAQQQALANPVVKEVVMQIGATELQTAQRQQLALTVPLSGTVRATQTALIKARVPGELQGLTLREGDSVRAGQEVAHIDPTEPRARLRQAQQQADAARAQVDISQRQFSNNRALVDQGFISRTALDTSQANLNAAQASYQAAMSAVDVAQKSLADTVLRSPLSGQVSQRLAQNGERVAVEARILEVVDLSRMELEALISPTDSVAVRVGQKAQLFIEGSDQRLPATVVRISPSAQAGSRAVPVYLGIDRDASTPALRHGLFVQGRLDVGRVERLVVPLDSVRIDKPEPYVQAAEQGRVAHYTVRLGERFEAQGQTLVAVQGVPEGAAVLAGRVGALPLGTLLRLPGAPATPQPSVAAEASAPAQAASARP